MGAFIREHAPTKSIKGCHHQSEIVLPQLGWTGFSIGVQRQQSAENASSLKRIKAANQTFTGAFSVAEHLFPSPFAYLSLSLSSTQ